MSTDTLEGVEMTKEKRASLRKSNKPIMEKRRRARINSCLTQLKSLVLEAMRKDSSQYSKLEKADILEMTVRHLRNLQRQQMSNALASDPNIVTKYRAGFNECAGEVLRYLNNAHCVNDDVRTKIVGHLSGCLQNVNSQSQQTSPIQCQQQSSPLQNQLHQPHPAGLQQVTPLIQPLSVQIPQSSHVNSVNQQFSSSSTVQHQQEATCLLMQGKVPQSNQSNCSVSPTFVNISTPVSVENNNQKISGSFQIVPGNLYNGPVAVYVGQVNDNQTSPSMPVFAVQVPQQNMDTSVFNRNKENVSAKQFNNQDFQLKSKQVLNNVSNINCQKSAVLSDSVWRPW